jgi:hypothetical protein
MKLLYPIMKNGELQVIRERLRISETLLSDIPNSKMPQCGILKQVSVKCQDHFFPKRNLKYFGHQ